MNSWHAMMHSGSNNATMTMEAWSRDENSGTYSHAWTSAPAYIVPRLLMGIRPVASAGVDAGPGLDAFRTFTVHPLPSPALPMASITMPTPRGQIAVSFAASFPASFPAAAARLDELRVEVLGNTRAQVCVPAYLVPGGCEVEITNAEVPVMCNTSGAAAGAGKAMLCCPGTLIAGQYELRIRCDATHTIAVQ